MECPFFLVDDWFSQSFIFPRLYSNFATAMVRWWIHWFCLFLRFVVFPLENHTFWYGDWFVILDHIPCYHQNRWKTTVIISILGVPNFCLEHHRPFFFKNASNYKPFWSASFFLLMTDFAILHISKVILKLCYGDGSLILCIFQNCCISYRKLHILVRWLIRHFGPYFIFVTRPC